MKENGLYGKQFKGEGEGLEEMGCHASLVEGELKLNYLNYPQALL